MMAITSTPETYRRYFLPRGWQKSLQARDLKIKVFLHGTCMARDLKTSTSANTTAPTENKRHFDAF